MRNLFRRATIECFPFSTALYEEIDKSLTKDDKIQQQKRNICCLKCNLSSKENELNCVRNELKILREQFASTLKEKHALADHLKASVDCV